MFLPADFDEYRRLSRRFKAAVARIDLTDSGRVIVNPVRADLPAKPGPKKGKK